MRFQIVLLLVTLVAAIRTDLDLSQQATIRTEAPLMHPTLFENSHGGCPTHQDCFNCTLAAACSWSGSTCSTSSQQDLTISSFMQRGAKCGDPSNICTKFFDSSRNVTTIGFNQSASGIPTNYFCIDKILDKYSAFDDENDSYHFRLPNQNWHHLPISEKMYIYNRKKMDTDQIKVKSSLRSYTIDTYLTNSDIFHQLDSKLKYMKIPSFYIERSNFLEIAIINTKYQNQSSFEAQFQYVPEENGRYNIPEETVFDYIPQILGGLLITLVAMACIQNICFDKSEMGSPRYRSSGGGIPRSRGTYQNLSDASGNGPGRSRNSQVRN